MSLPTRERGLKLSANRHNSVPLESLPTRERGLKLLGCVLRIQTRRVAPHAGAWIETFSSTHDNHDYVSLPTRERGLKHIIIMFSVCLSCRSPRGSVD